MSENIVSLFQRKAEALGVKDTNRLVDICPLCGAAVSACDVDKEKTVRFICVSVAHESISWSQEKMADRTFATRRKNADR